MAPGGMVLGRHGQGRGLSCPASVVSTGSTPESCDWSRAREVDLALTRQEAASESRSGKTRGTKRQPSELSSEYPRLAHNTKAKQLTGSCRRRRRGDWVSGAHGDAVREDDVQGGKKGLGCRRFFVAHCESTVGRHRRWSLWGSSGLFVSRPVFG